MILRDFIPLDVQVSLAAEKAKKQPVMVARAIKSMAGQMYSTQDMQAYNYVREHIANKLDGKAKEAFLSNSFVGG